MSRRIVIGGRKTLLDSLKHLYARVARQTGFEKSYIVRVALGEVKSDIVEAALEKELRKLARSLRSATSRSGNRKTIRFRRDPP